MLDTEGGRGKRTSRIVDPVCVFWNFSLSTEEYVLAIIVIIKIDERTQLMPYCSHSFILNVLRYMTWV